jgi:hypothetical protein
MIGLAITLMRLGLRVSFATIDLLVWMCTLGKVDPRSRRIV